jgi:Methyltransferase domain
LTGNFISAISGRYGEAFASGLAAIAGSVQRPGISILEFGAGESTRILAEIADAREGHLLSIDHDRDYLAAVAASVNSRRVDFRWLDVDGPRESQFDPEYNYASYPLGLGQKFDFVFIDGRRRVECALTAALLIPPDGLVVLHDYARIRYDAISGLFHRIETVGQFLVMREPRIPPLDRGCPAERRAVVQVVSGRAAQREHEITRPSVEAYAAAIDAEFRVRTFPDDRPPAALKFLIREQLDAYDRILLLDTDVVIRRGSPDIFQLVPHGRIGAWRQDRVFPDMTSALNKEFRHHEGSSAEPLTTYINSGVLVIPREQYDILDPPPVTHFLGLPLHEEAYLNSKIFDEKRPFFNLSYDFNFIPSSNTFLDDRFGSFIHLAGAGKAKSTYGMAWRSTGSALGIEWLQRAPLAGRNTRLPRLAALDLTVRGIMTRAFDPDDFVSFAPSRVLIIGHVAHLMVHPISNEAGICVFGPYAAMARGSYRLMLDHDASLTRSETTVSYDIAYSRDGELHVELAHQKKVSDTFEFSLGHDVTDFQVRFHPSARPYFIRGVLITTLADRPDQD